MDAIDVLDVRVGVRTLFGGFDPVSAHLFDRAAPEVFAPRMVYPGQIITVVLRNNAPHLVQATYAALGDVSAEDTR